MTTDDVLGFVLHAAEGLGRSFSHEEVSSWPTGTLELLVRLGVLRESSSSTMAECPECDDRHASPVVVMDDGAGVKRLYIACPEHLRVEVSADACRSWNVDPTGLARCVGAALGIKGNPKLIAGGLSEVGSTRIGSASRQVLLSLDASAAGVDRLARRVGQSGRAIVVVPHRAPDERRWFGRVPAVVELSQVATVDGAGLAIDAQLAHSIVAASDAAADAKSVLPTDPAQKRQIVRQQLKAELKGYDWDAVLIAGYRECSSYRRAAALLTERTHRTVTKDDVFRAVQRAGGVDAVMADGDSASVSRRVASQRGDRVTKMMQHGK